MKKIVIVSTLLAICLASSSAFAANSEGKKKAKAKPIAPVTEVAKASVSAPARDWTGLYVGLNGGYSFSGTSTSDGYDTSYITTIQGGYGGGQVGYDVQSGRTVFGVVADADLSGTKGSVTNIDVITNSETYTASLRLKGGYLIDDNTLVYLTAGYSANNQKLEDTTYSISDTKLLNGYVVGGGIEQFLAKNISAFAEYRYSSYGTATYTWNGSISVDYSQSEVRVGLNFHF
jgi:outer membrane immunogenic protein